MSSLQLTPNSVYPLIWLWGGLVQATLGNPSGNNPPLFLILPTTETTEGASPQRRTIPNTPLSLYHTKLGEKYEFINQNYIKKATLPGKSPLSNC